MLNKKKQMFCEEYIQDFNATQSAIRAGYSADTAYSKGYTLLREVEVEDYLQELLADRKKTMGISSAEIVQGLKQLAYFSEKDSDRIKSFELLGKYLGIWTEKRDIKLETKVKFKELTDEELDKALEDLE